MHKMFANIGTTCTCIRGKCAKTINMSTEEYVASWFHDFEHDSITDIQPRIILV